ncbi:MULTISPECIES: TetR family transcriptional regulator [unclassified Streptomyces]|uniref:TetR/AcrR family transcriptional regulator n=1 Tax=unclassified Streptomyces TaxID=2593676 RepID=UPI000DBAAF28|nr:TetR family transcriptional regulator [Streptomyces sp. PsTaAH-130]MYU07261.1 TetR family transcriptional regulator [Streptomyces sp. SID8366]MYU64421.1 TetR family transcriptional regulator [Streptomyces sp. SID69]RAJ61510.1 TetR family transcriptional regulator [Streptomyces sp. PsTaAH-130]
MKLTKERIVDAGMAVFAEAGYQNLSMRQVADRLDAHAGSLYYHVRGKEELLALLADRVCRRAHDAGTDALAALPSTATWQDRVEAQVTTLRAEIEQHPGGAQLLAESPGMLSTGAFLLMERLLRTLLDGGLPAAHCGIAADTLLSHVTGFVLQEQNQPAAPPTVTAGQYADLRERFPLVMGDLIPRLSHDEKFVRSIRLLCTGFTALH